MDEFEQHLKNQPLRVVPAEWREEILSTASGSARDLEYAVPRFDGSSQNEPSAHESGYVVPPLGGSVSSQNPSPGPWWRRWLWPSPYAWGALAFAWVIIFVLNAAAQPSRAEIEARGPAPNPQEIMAMLDEWRKIEDEFTRPQPRASSAPAQPPSPQPPTPGAYLEERKTKAALLV